MVRQLLDCASPLALLKRGLARPWALAWSRRCGCPWESGRGLPQSKTLSRFRGRLAQYTAFAGIQPDTHLNLIGVIVTARSELTLAATVQEVTLQRKLPGTTDPENSKFSPLKTRKNAKEKELELCSGSFPGGTTKLLEVLLRFRVG